jgi:hypothetical protein
LEPNRFLNDLDVHCNDLGSSVFLASLLRYFILMLKKGSKPRPRPCSNPWFIYILRHTAFSDCLRPNRGQVRFEVLTLRSHRDGRPPRPVNAYPPETGGCEPAFDRASSPHAARLPRRPPPPTPKIPRDGSVAWEQDGGEGCLTEPPRPDQKMWPPVPPRPVAFPIAR